MNVLYECLGIRICIRSSVSFSGFGAKPAVQALGISFPSPGEIRHPS